MKYIVRSYDWQGHLAFEYEEKTQMAAEQRASIEINCGALKEVVIRKEETYDEHL